MTVFDPRVVRPLDPALVERCRNARLVVTAEDGSSTAGRASACVVSSSAPRARRRAAADVLCLGVPTVYVGHANPDLILERLELDASGFAASVRTAYEGSPG